MNKLLEGFRAWRETGIPSEPEIFYATSAIIDSMFRKIASIKPNYFNEFGYSDEESFIRLFEEVFWSEKLVSNDVMLMLCSQKGDDEVRKTLYWLVEQFYNTIFMSEGIRDSRTTLDVIIKKLEVHGFIKITSFNKLKKTMRIELLKNFSYDDVLPLFSVTFKNNDTKTRSLNLVVFELERLNRCFYYDLIDALQIFYKGYDFKTVSYDQLFSESGNDDDDQLFEESEQEYEEDTSIDTPNFEEDAESLCDKTKVTQDFFGFALENLKDYYSDIIEHEPVNLNRPVCLFTNKDAFILELKNEIDNISDDTSHFLKAALKRLKIEEINVFMLTLLYTGLSDKPIPIAVRTRIGELMAFSPANFYIHYKGFTEVMKVLKEDERFAVENNDYIVAIDLLFKTFKRNCIV
jgi:hypothetical protein